MPLLIGQWAARYARSGSGLPTTTAHLVDSTRGDPLRVVTRCGREMAVDAPAGRRGQLVQANGGTAHCWKCYTTLPPHLPAQV